MWNNHQNKMDTGVSSILQLNDDCLWCIFSYFDLPELLIAGSVCQRFEGIAQMFYKNDKNCQSVDLWELNKGFYKNGIRHPGLGEVFRQLETHMIAMKIGYISYENILGCPKFPILTFPNLQHIMLHRGTKIHEEYAEMFPALKQIVLDLDSKSFRDESVLSCWFNNSPHLKILKFSYIWNMTGKCLVGLKGIEELKIENCKHIQPKFFEQFCKMNRQLKKLSFVFINTITIHTFLEIITKYLKNLKSLVIHDEAKNEWTNYDILRDLPKITKLRLDVWPTKQSLKYNNLLEHFANNNHIEYLNLGYVTEDVLNIRQQFLYLKVFKLMSTYKLSFEKISNFISCSTTLEELHIVRCDFESSAGLKEFIEKYKSLRLLNVYASWAFKFSFLMEIEECLQNRTQILEIAIKCTSFAQELQEESKSEVLKDFLDRTKEKLKLTIEMPKKSFHECDEWEVPL